jgi:DNA-binding CsgD family transcriptional regulator
MTVKDIRPPEDVPWLLEKISAIKPGMNSASSRHLKKNGRLFRSKSSLIPCRSTIGERNWCWRWRSRMTRFLFTEFWIRIEDLRLDRKGFEDDQLTEAECRIAALVARGYSNKQIAATAGISVRTVENHISHILGKKHFTNRVEIAGLYFAKSAARVEAG